MLLTKSRSALNSPRWWAIACWRSASPARSALFQSPCPPASASSVPPRACGTPRSGPCTGGIRAPALFVLSGGTGPWLAYHSGGSAVHHRGSVRRALFIWTGFVCPIRWNRSMVCTSQWGFFGTHQGKNKWVHMGTHDAYSTVHRLPLTGPVALVDQSQRRSGHACEAVTQVSRAGTQAHFTPVPPLDHCTPTLLRCKNVVPASSCFLTQSLS